MMQIHLVFIVIHLTALVLFAFALWITVPLHIIYTAIQLWRGTRNTVLHSDSEKE